jgi:hypothetical protein
MSRTLEIPDELYERIERAAEETGTTPVTWLDQHVPKANGRPEDSASLYERMKDHIGKYTVDWDKLKEDPNDPFFNDILRQQRGDRP